MIEDRTVDRFGERKERAYCRAAFWQRSDMAAAMVELSLECDSIPIAMRCPTLNILGRNPIRLGETQSNKSLACPKLHAGF